MTPLLCACARKQSLGYAVRSQPQDVDLYLPCPKSSRRLSTSEPASRAHLTNFSFEYFYKIFTEDASQPLLYHGAKKKPSRLKKFPMILCQQSSTEEGSRRHPLLCLFSRRRLRTVEQKDIKLEPWVVFLFVKCWFLRRWLSPWKASLTSSVDSCTKTGYLKTTWCKHLRQLHSRVSKPERNGFEMS